MSERKPTLAYGTTKRRYRWTTDLIILAVLCGLILAVVFGFWYFCIKPDLDKGIWP